MEDINRFEGITLDTVTEKQINDTKYGELKMLMDHLDITIKTTFGIKKDVLCKEIWRAVKIKREQLEKGLTKEQMAEDNAKRDEAKTNAEKADKLTKLKEEEKEKMQIVNANLAKPQPVTKEYAIEAIATITRSLEIKRKTKGQRKNSLAKLRKYEIILAEYNKQEQQEQQ